MTLLAKSVVCCRPVVCRNGRNALLSSSSIMNPPAPPSANPKMGILDEEFTHYSKEQIATDIRTGQESIYKLGRHRSNAMELVHKVPVTEVDGDMAICDGGGAALGHPLEYISLAVPDAVVYCPYCALRYTKKKS